MESVFTSIPQKQWLHQSEYFFIVPDKYPVSDGHLLIVSKRHLHDFFELDGEEQNELPKLITKAKTIIEKLHSPSGYNIGMNCGAAAGQTVFHMHCHLIPRYRGDMQRPEGGVRGVIPGKQQYG